MCKFRETRNFDEIIWNSWNFAKFGENLTKFEENYAKYEILTTFVWISQNFMKFGENFAKHEINYFAKISLNYENENFCSNPTPTQSAVCCTHKLPSAKTIFCCAAMLLWDEADIYTVVFHSVIYNSVGGI